MGTKLTNKAVKRKAKPKTTKAAAMHSAKGGEKYQQSGAPWWKAYLPE